MDDTCGLCERRLAFLAGDSGDSAIMTVFDELVGPAAQRFKPDIILVRATSWTPCSHHAGQIFHILARQIVTNRQMRELMHPRPALKTVAQAGKSCLGMACWHRRAQRCRTNTLASQL